MLLNRAGSGAPGRKQSKSRSRGLLDNQYDTFRPTWRRTRTARRQAHVWRLRLSVVGVLILLIVMISADFRTTERMIQRQQVLSAAYRSHLLFADLETVLKGLHIAASVYIHDGTSTRRIDTRRSYAEARQILASIQKSPRVPQSSARDRYTDLLPRTRLYLDALQRGVDLRDAGRPQEALATLTGSNSVYERLQHLSARLRSDEESRLVELTEQIEQEAEQERNKTWLWTSLVTVLLGAAGLFFSRDLGSRMRQEQALRNANRALTRLAEQDGLTHLKNRRALEEELHSEWARARRYHTPLSLLFVDVDKFKEYNDTFGHQAGDEALKQVADLLRQEQRLSGGYVARYGGEEFAIVLPQKGRDEARRVGERVRASFESASWRGRPVTASVGAATLDQAPRSISDIDTLLYEADGALYHAKREGRNQVAHAADLFSLPPIPALQLKTPVG